MNSLYFNSQKIILDDTKAEDFFYILTNEI
jgi:hypothetical protein